MKNFTSRLLILLSIGVCQTAFASPAINVEIRGISGELLDNVRLFLSIEQHKDNALINEGRLRRLHQKAPPEISKALQPFGYYRPVIKPELTRVGEEQWQAVYTVDAGPPLLVTEMQLITNDELKLDPEFKALLDNLPLQQGDVLNHARYESIKTSLARVAADRGYFKARLIEHRVEVNLKSYSAQVLLNYDSGIRYRFGEVHMDQNVLDPDFLRRYIPFKRGEPYTLEGLISLQQALNDSDYFNRVEVSAGQVPMNSDEVPVNVVLEERKQNRYILGVGYGTDTGARARLGWEIPRFNKKGHRISSEVQVTEIGYSVSASYRVPVLNPRTDQILYKAGVVNEKTDTSDSTVKTIGSSLNRSRGQWREVISINYQQEKFVIADDRGESTLVMPGINWSRNWGGNVINTFEGLRFDIGLRGASEDVLSDTSFFQLEGGIKAITSLSDTQRLISRGRVGSTWTDEFNQLPSSVRFFTGGAQSVRGYAYQALGPTDSDGDVTGGRHLMVGSLEYEQYFGNKWGFALFYDAGNAIDDFNDKLERGAGFGLRWKSPIGPVRIDLGNAISSNKDWRLHINIGPDL
jgi:translocation and assembly module TamA